MKKTTIEYDFQENPSKAIDQNGSACHIRIQNSQTITLEEIADRLQRTSTVTGVDFAAVMTGLEDVIIDELSQGNSVSLDGICRLEPILGTKDKCKGTEKGNEVLLKSVRIRPAKSLVERVETNLSPCTRVHVKRSPKLSEGELCDWLSVYFKSNSFIRRVVLEQELGFTRSLACKLLHQLVKEGKLLHPGPTNDSLYYPSPEYFKN